MHTVTACLAGPADVAARLAKKGTESDFTIYNLKRGDRVLVVTHPSRFPEKATSLLFAASMADAGVLVAERVDAALGEAIVALDLAGPDRGFIVMRGIVPEQAAPLLKGTRLAPWPAVDERELQERLLALDAPPVTGPVRVPVDHFFNVKGVGTVALGQVRRGTLRRHADLELAPLGRRVQVRSIQLQDEDVEEAPWGSRPGAALKGIEAGEMERGCVLSEPGSLSSGAAVRARVGHHPFFRGGPGAGGAGLHLFLNLQVCPVTLEGEWPAPGGTAEVVLKADRPLAFAAGDRGVLVNLSGKGLRFAGGVDITGAAQER